MFDRIKQALNNSFLWLIGLLAAVGYFWKREKDLERELSETKADKELQSEKGEQKTIDAAASDAIREFERVAAESVSAGDRSGNKGDSGPAGSN